MLLAFSHKRIKVSYGDGDPKLYNLYSGQSKPEGKPRYAIQLNDTGSF